MTGLGSSKVKEVYILHHPDFFNTSSTNLSILYSHTCCSGHGSRWHFFQVRRTHHAGLPPTGPGHVVWIWFCVLWRNLSRITLEVNEVYVFESFFLPLIFDSLLFIRVDLFSRFLCVVTTISSHLHWSRSEFTRVSWILRRAMMQTWAFRNDVHQKMNCICKKYVQL